MADTAIEWTEHSWNPIVGCSLATPGCTNCYAMKMARRLERMGTVAHYAGLTKETKAGPVWTGKMVQAPEHVLLEPLRRRKPTTWFVNSMSDLFHEDVPDAWIDRVFAVMALCPQHTFQVLTKRAARMRAYMASAHERIADAAMSAAPVGLDISRSGIIWQPHCLPSTSFERWPLPNVWLGVSAEDQRRAEERIPDLLATPAAIRFVSAEPLLGPIDFDMLRVGDAWMIGALTGIYGALPGNRGEKLDLIIVGGESGKGARHMEDIWAESIQAQCAASGTAFFMKQMGGPVKARMRPIPQHLMVREMPARCGGPSHG